MSSLDYLELCRLCLVKDNVSVPIFEEEGDLRQIYFKISSCLPVKVSREDKLPKKICDECGYKVELLYQFWNTTANAEKQLLQWLGEVGIEDKQGYVTEVLDSSVMKQERSSDNRLDGSVMQVGDHQNNIDINMIDNISIITMPAVSEQQFTTVPMDTSGTVQTVQAVPGPSTQTTHDQIVQSQTHATEVEEESEEENYDDGCDNEGMTVKEETEDHNEQPLDSTFVNVTLPCDEAGPSGLHQQKISELTEITSQTADGDPKTGKKKQEEKYSKNCALTELKIAQPFTNKAQSGFTCPHCQKTLKNKRTLTEHIKQIHKNIGEIYKCEHCDYRTNSPRNLKSHRLLHEHTEKICNLCDLLLPSEIALRAHRLSQHKPSLDPHNLDAPASYKCDQCSERFSSRLHLARHRPSHRNQIRTRCPKCQRFFPDVASFDRHLNEVHLNPQLVECDTCKRQFKSKARLILHMGMHDKRHSCPQCSRLFSTRALLKQHLRRHEKRYRDYCEYCGKGFYGRAQLALHLVSHTDERPYVCELCGGAYRSPGSLGLHRRSHEDEQSRPSFTCELCGFRTWHRNALKLHVESHVGGNTANCELCGKSVVKSRMKEHVRLHTGERPYTCQYCDKNFVSAKNLQVHVRLHTGEKPYECEICRRRFTQSASLKAHLKAHENQKKRGRPRRRAYVD